MRGSFAVVAASLLALSFAQPGLSQGAIGSGGRPRVQVGTVTTMNSVTMNFTCQGKMGARTYWVTRATRFRAGGSDASFFDLGTGGPVAVIFHDAGRLAIADQVIFLR